MSSVDSKLFLPALPVNFHYRLDLRKAVTARELKEAPFHRWFYFPHSFSPSLLYEVLAFWNLPQGARFLDPYMGAGTTLVVARQLGLDAEGWDILPLSVLVSQVKSRTYEVQAIDQTFSQVMSAYDTGDVDVDSLPDRLRKAFTLEELKTLMDLRRAIEQQAPPLKELFLVALLNTAHIYSRAIPDGGWFRWVKKENRPNLIPSSFAEHVRQMRQDVETDKSHRRSGKIRSRFGDSRFQTPQEEKVNAVITSPPYPNRHDYSRVFHIDLLMLGQTEAQITNLRRQSIRSHVEAKMPAEQQANQFDFRPPTSLVTALDALPAGADLRIRSMLIGYFADMYASLVNIRRSLVEGGKVAFVVGNVRHAGIPILVDEILVDVARNIGFSHQASWVARLRGNSAQQMGRYGRVAARESVVLLQKESVS